MQKYIEFNDCELAEFSSAIITIGTFLPDIEGVEAPIKEFATLLRLHKKMNNVNLILIQPATSN